MSSLSQHLSSTHVELILDSTFFSGWGRPFVGDVGRTTLFLEQLQAIANTTTLRRYIDNNPMTSTFPSSRTAYHFRKRWPVGSENAAPGRMDMLMFPVEDSPIPLSITGGSEYAVYLKIWCSDTFRGHGSMHMS